MLKYLAKTEIAGIEIRIIKSAFGYAVIYGVKTYHHDGKDEAWAEYQRCVAHAIELD